MRALPRLLSLAAALALLPACSGGSGGGDDDDDAGTDYIETGRVEITLLIPPTGIPVQDPFAGVTTYHVAILDSAGGIIVQDDFAASDPIEIRSLDPGSGRVVVLEGGDGVNTLSRGRTLPFDVVEGPTPVQRDLYFSRVGQFSTVYGSPAARIGAATWTFSDGRVLIAGGLDGGAAIASAEIFDWVSDSVVTAGSMSSGGTAFSVTASLGGDTVLICGGVTDGAGTPTSITNVYVHVPGGVGTWATGVPAMPGARREHAGAELGTGRALVAGGSATTAATGPALDTTFLFEWNGALGAWTTLVGMEQNEPRMGHLALPVSGDVVLFVGGFNNNVSGGNDDFSDDGDVFSWNGANVVRAPGGGPQIGTSRGWSSWLEVTANQWLVWGGEEGDNNNHNLLDAVELWTWNGSTLNDNSLSDNLADPQRGGAAGVLNGNQLLLLGGNTGEYPANTPSNVAATYDVPGETYTDLAASPGATLGGTAAPLPDGTSLVVIDGAVLRFNPF